MRDAVAEILLERAAIDGGRQSAVAASVALHAAIAFLALYSARSADLEPRRVITLRLSSPATRPAGSTATAGVVRPHTVRPHSTPKPDAKPQLPDPVTVPETRVMTAPAKTEVHQKGLFGKAKPGVAIPIPRTAVKVPGTAAGGSPSTTIPDAAPTAGAASSLPAVGTAGVTAVDGGEFPFDTYLSRMVSLVGTHWFRPQTRDDALAAVYFVINRDGSIRDARLEKTSGSSLFDRAALRSVVEASPLPPLPFAFQGTFLGVHLTFH